MVYSIFNTSTRLPFPYRVVQWLRLFSIETGRAEDKTDSRETWFAKILAEYSPVISSICFSYATDNEDLKDLRQDILLNIWKGLHSFRGDCGLSTWIYRVALNTCVSTVRKRSKRPATIPLEGLTEIASDTESGLKERTETLHSIIARLSPLDKAVITMWLDDRKYEEIAEVTGISRNNVAVRINRIKQKLHHKFNH